MKFHFTFFQTPAVRKVSPIAIALRNAIRSIAQFVAETELEELTEFRLSIIALSDPEMLELNRSALGHDWLTDVIAFEIDRSGGMLEAEIYVSPERAYENAKRFRQPPELEILHLVIHGVLHLAGYNDKSPNGKKQMRARERWYLVRFRS